MKYVLFYDSAPDVGVRAREAFPAHRARLDAFHSAGTLLLIGTFEDAQRDGSMAVFSSRAAAEDFAAGDPFVVNGVVSGWRVLGWNEMLG